MNLYRRFDVDEDTPVQFVGVYTTCWHPEDWGQPTAMFAEAEDADLLDVARQLPEVVALVKRLEQARDAIQSLPEDALGMCGSGAEQWPISEELLHHINVDLAPFQEAK